MGTKPNPLPTPSPPPTPGRSDIDKLESLLDADSANPECDVDSPCGSPTSTAWAYALQWSAPGTLAQTLAAIETTTTSEAVASVGVPIGAKNGGRRPSHRRVQSCTDLSGLAQAARETGVTRG